MDFMFLSYDLLNMMSNYTVLEHAVGTPSCSSSSYHLFFSDICLSFLDVISSTYFTTSYRNSDSAIFRYFYLFLRLSWNFFLFSFFIFLFPSDRFMWVQYPIFLLTYARTRYTLDNILKIYQIKMLRFLRIRNQHWWLTAAILLMMPGWRMK